MPKLELDVPQETLDAMCDAQKAEGSPIRIVVLHRGWIVVGKYCREDDEVVIRSAKVIRRWGTTKGLGEIASNGPTDKTVLDHCGVVRVHHLGVVFSMECNQEKWDDF